MKYFNALKYFKAFCLHGIERNVGESITTQCHDDLSSFTSQSTQTVGKNAPVSGLSQQVVVHLFQ